MEENIVWQEVAMVLVARYVLNVIQIEKKQLK